MSISIKILSPDDLKLAQDLFLAFQKDDAVENPSSASDEYVRQLLSKADLHVIVATASEKVVGGLVAYELPMFKEETSEMYLFELGVNEDFRRRGIASALIDSLKEVSAKKKIDIMYVGAWADNLPAVELYKKTGGNGREVMEFTYELDQKT